MWSNTELRGTTAHILASAMTRKQKLRSLLVVRRQLKSFLRAVRQGIATMDANLHTMGSRRLRQVERQLQDGVTYLSELARAVSAQRHTFGYEACAKAYPYSWEGARI